MIPNDRDDGKAVKALIVVAGGGRCLTSAAIPPATKPEFMPLSQRCVWAALVLHRIIYQLPVIDRPVVARAGAIPPLVGMLSSGVPGRHRSMAAAVLGIIACQNDADQHAVIDAGAVPSLVALFKTGTRKARQAAVAAMSTICVGDENAAIHQAMEAEGVIGPLVEMAKQATTAQERLQATCALRLFARTCAFGLRKATRSPNFDLWRLGAAVVDAGGLEVLGAFVTSTSRVRICGAASTFAWLNDNPDHPQHAEECLAYHAEATIRYLLDLRHLRRLGDGGSADDFAEWQSTSTSLWHFRF